MLKISNWIDKNYYVIKKECIRIKSPDWYDIYHEVLIQFLEMDSGKTSSLINHQSAVRYIKQMFYLNVISKTAPYFNMYKMEEELRCNFDDIIEDKHEHTEMCWADFESALYEVDAFFIDKLIYKDYILNKTKTPGYSVNKISQETKIPVATLIKKFTFIREELKKIINE